MPNRRTVIRIGLAAVVVAAVVLIVIGTDDRLRQASLFAVLIALLLAQRYAL